MWEKKIYQKNKPVNKNWGNYINYLFLKMKESLFFIFFIKHNKKMSFIESFSKVFSRPEVDFPVNAVNPLDLSHGQWYVKLFHDL
jgi:hypothetical protein